MAKNLSLPVDVEKGKTYSWCRCGLSETLPICDNSHKRGKTSDIPLDFVAEQTATVYLCACGKTENQPYCDGFTCDKSSS
jgi:CDGSH-type Zn-finger protein